MRIAAAVIGLVKTPIAVLARALIDPQWHVPAATALEGSAAVRAASIDPGREVQFDFALGVFLDLAPLPGPEIPGVAIEPDLVDPVAAGGAPLARSMTPSMVSASPIGPPPCAVTRKAVVGMASPPGTRRRGALPVGRSPLSVLRRLPSHRPTLHPLTQFAWRCLPCRVGIESDVRVRARATRDRPYIVPRDADHERVVRPPRTGNIGRPRIPPAGPLNLCSSARARTKRMRHRILGEPQHPRRRTSFRPTRKK